MLLKDTTGQKSFAVVLEHDVLIDFSDLKEWSAPTKDEFSVT